MINPVIARGIAMTNTEAARVQAQMQDCLERLCVNLIVLWKPHSSKAVHGRAMIVKSKKQPAFQQPTLLGKDDVKQPIAPPKGLCAENCYLAVNVACHCRCGGLYHELGAQAAAEKKNDEDQEASRIE
jgi:hypothetical protein